jgi:chemotaxis receptor (MCP) glutamine deamidase CheD
MGADNAKTKKHRERARQIRIIAEDVRGDESRKFLLTRDYEGLADALSRPRGTRRNSKPPN